VSRDGRRRIRRVGVAESILLVVDEAASGPILTRFFLFNCLSNCIEYKDKLTGRSDFA
jgi:hypothetical protein